MGEVYRARDPRLDRDVAIKVLPALFAEDPDRVRRFEVEARAVGRLNHPNVLAIHDVGRVPDGLDAAGAPYLVCELLDGRTLRDEMQGRALPLRMALSVARAIAAGLAAAHEKGVTHRDLKPENVFVTRDGHVKILDFGLAKLRPDAGPLAGEPVTATARATGPGVVMGTAGYMSPEQVRGQDVDHRSDIFSFGAVLYELLTGRPAFPGATAVETMGAVLHVDPPAMSSGSSDAAVPSAVDRIVHRCLEKAPDRRFQSARDLAFAFEAVGEDAATPAVAASRPATGGQRWRGVMILTGLGVAAVAGWAIWSVALRDRAAPTSATLAAPASVTPFLSGPAVEGLPAWSPTANLIAYVSDASGNEDVWITDVTGASPINLTRDHAGIDTFPAWAPDGQHIAFYSDRDGGGIYAMTPLGANVSRIVPVRPSVLYTFSLQWADDGSLVYTDFDDAGEKQIFRVSTTGTAPACLTCGLAAVPAGRAGTLSPSGRLLAFVGALMGPRPSLFVLNLSSGRLTELADRADAPEWRDDGHLLFLSARDGLTDLWEIAVDPESGTGTSEPVRITSGLEATAFAVSRGGREMLAVKEKSSSTLWVFPTEAPRIDSLEQGNSLTSGPYRDERPRWSADGREVFFESNRRGSVNVWKVAVEGGEPTRITSGVGLESRPRPSPDGQWLTFDKDGNWTWLVRPDGSGAHAPADWEPRYSNVCCSAWSPDSRRVILTVRTRSDDSRLIFADLDGRTGLLGGLREVEMPGALEEYPRSSPDGRAFAFESFSEGSFNVWVAGADGSSPRQITHAAGNERSAAWQASPLYLYWRDERSIWRMPMTDAATAAGAPARWLAIPGLGVTTDSIDVSSDSTRVVVALLRPESDIWLVERK